MKLPEANRLPRLERQKQIDKAVREREIKKQAMPHNPYKIYIGTVGCF
jgi:hypothetical protein